MKKDKAGLITVTTEDFEVMGMKVAKFDDKFEDLPPTVQEAIRGKANKIAEELEESFTAFILNNPSLAVTTEEAKH